MVEAIKRHYSDKGGHKERSDFWAGLRKFNREQYPDKVVDWNIRRTMMRAPQDGKIQK